MGYRHCIKNQYRIKYGSSGQLPISGPSGEVGVFYRAPLPRLEAGSPKQLGIATQPAVVSARFQQQAIQQLPPRDTP